MTSGFTCDQVHTRSRRGTLVRGHPPVCRQVRPTGPPCPCVGVLKRRRAVYINASPWRCVPRAGWWGRASRQPYRGHGAWPRPTRRRLPPASQCVPPAGPRLPPVSAPSSVPGTHPCLRSRPERLGVQLECRVFPFKSKPAIVMAIALRYCGRPPCAAPGSAYDRLAGPRWSNGSPTGLLWPARVQRRVRVLGGGFVSFHPQLIALHPCGCRYPCALC
jgi:hypothetical protein